MTTRLVLKKFKKIVLASLYVNGIKICGSVGNEIQKFPKGDGFVVDVKLLLTRSMQTSSGTNHRSEKSHMIITTPTSRRSKPFVLWDGNGASEISHQSMHPPISDRKPIWVIL